MSIIEGFGLCDPEVVCMDVVSINTINRIAKNSDPPPLNLNCTFF